MDYELLIAENLGMNIDAFDSLLTKLEELRTLLDKAGVERYCGLRKFSEYGRDCVYVKAAGKDIVLNRRLDPILRKLKELNGP